jgi:hypothetical protein
VAKVDERNRELILQTKEFSSKEDVLALLEKSVLDIHFEKSRRAESC